MGCLYHHVDYLYRIYRRWNIPFLPILCVLESQVKSYEAEVFSHYGF